MPTRIGHETSCPGEQGHTDMQILVGQPIKAVGHS